MRPGGHSHPRAQLLFAIAGVMRIATERGAVHHTGRNRASGCRRNPAHEVGWTARCKCARCSCAPMLRPWTRSDTAVIAVSPLLRELILTVCNEPVVWDARGPIRLVASLALHEIGRAAARRPLSLPACHDPRVGSGCRAHWSPIRPIPATWMPCATVAGASVRNVDAAVPDGNRHEFPAVAASVAHDRGAGPARQGNRRPGSCSSRLRQRAGLRCGIPQNVRNDTVGGRAGGWDNRPRKRLP